jgi:hypothetical protein
MIGYRPMLRALLVFLALMTGFAATPAGADGPYS